MVVKLLIGVHVFPMHMLTLLSVDEILLSRKVKWFTNFKDLTFSIEMVPSCLNTHKLCFIWVHKEVNATCCTSCTLRKCLDKKQDGNSTRILHADLNKSWKQHPTKQQLYTHLTNHPSKMNKTYWSLLENQERTHKQIVWFDCMAHQPL